RRGQPGDAQIAADVDHRPLGAVGDEARGDEVRSQALADATEIEPYAGGQLGDTRRLVEHDARASGRGERGPAAGADVAAPADLVDVVVVAEAQQRVVDRRVEGPL